MRETYWDRGGEKTVPVNAPEEERGERRHAKQQRILLQERGTPLFRVERRRKKGITLGRNRSVSKEKKKCPF